MLTRPERASATALADARRAESRTASGSTAVRGQRATVAAASRLFVEGRHDAELVEKVWGDDLRVEGVVVEMLDGVDDLPTAIAAFGPGPGRRMGVLVDHLVPGTKESGIVDAVRALPGARGHLLVLGHPYVDVWQSVRPARLGLDAWPVVPRGPGLEARDLRGARLAARHSGGHRAGLEADPRPGAQLCRPRADPAGQCRGAHRLRHGSGDTLTGP